MAEYPLSELAAGAQFSGFVVAKEKNMAKTRAGKPYLSLLVADAERSLVARAWDNAAQLAPLFAAGDVVWITATVDAYQGKLNLSISELRKAGPGEYDAALLTRVSSYDPQDQWCQVCELLQTITDADLARLRDQIINNKALVEAFCNSAAARKVHHDYLGGLVEHTLSVMQIAAFLADHYPGVDRDMVLMGALLHDIGKLQEFDTGMDISLRPEGALLGHINLSLLLTNEFVRRLEKFPTKKKLLLEHIITSHQGQLEWGSPTLPSTPEALLLHFADNTDAKMYIIRHDIAEHEDESPYTARNYFMSRSFVDPQKL